MEIFGRGQSEVIDGIEVRGRAAFRARTREALDLLRLGALFGGAGQHYRSPLNHAGTPALPARLPDR